MFLGTTPSVILQYVNGRVSEMKPKRAFVPFAGNFCVEQAIAGAGKEIQIHSTDISLYSRVIGLGLTNQVCEAKPGPKLTEMFPHVASKTTPLEKAAQIIFFTEICQTMEKAYKGIDYYISLMNDAAYNQEAYFKKIYEKVERFKGYIGHMHFYGMDACAVLEGVEEGDFVYYDPPFFDGGYEKMFAEVEANYEFNPVPFTVIGEAMVKDHLQEFSDKGATAYYRSLHALTNGEIPDEYEEVYRYGYKQDGNYFLYTNARNVKKQVTRFEAIKETVVHYPLIDITDTITRKSKVEFLKVKEAVSNHYRLMWIKKARMSSGGVPYLIFVDKKMIGLVHISSGQQFGTDLAGIFTDPSCPLSKYKRLSKLIIYLISTQEFLDIFNEEALWIHTGFGTKVTTNERVSMKYRGLFELIKTEEAKEGNYKYHLLYQNRKNIFKTCREALSNWLDKDGKLLI